MRQGVRRRACLSPCLPRCLAALLPRRPRLPLPEQVQRATQSTLRCSSLAPFVPRPWPCPHLVALLAHAKPERVRKAPTHARLTPASARLALPCLALREELQLQPSQFTPAPPSQGQPPKLSRPIAPPSPSPTSRASHVARQRHHPPAHSKAWNRAACSTHTRMRHAFRCLPCSTHASTRG